MVRCDSLMKKTHSRWQESCIHNRSLQKRYVVNKSTTTRNLPRSSSHHGHQHKATPPRRNARLKASTRRGDWNTCFNLGDGNAGREAEELLPSPNFYVHSGEKIPSLAGWGFWSSRYISFSHLSGSNSGLGHHVVKELSVYQFASLMSRPARSLTIARLNNAFLGCFSHLRPSVTLDHLVRCLGTWNGSELRDFAFELLCQNLSTRCLVNSSWWAVQNYTFVGLSVLMDAIVLGRAVCSEIDRTVLAPSRKPKTSGWNAQDASK